MHRRLAAQRRTVKLAGTVRNHLVDIHIELRAASGHPDMQGEHVVMPTSQNLVRDRDDQIVDLLIHSLARVVGVGGSLLQNGEGRDQFARDQILPNAEIFERALGLGAPQLVSLDLDRAHGVGFFTEAGHDGLSNDSGDDRHVTSVSARKGCFGTQDPAR
jgi:hypothetical protein